MNKDKVLEILHRLGFQPEEIDDGLGYRFDFEGLTFLFSPMEADDSTLYLVVPEVYEVTEENRVSALEAMVKLTGKMKFVQPSIYWDSVWLCYQHFLGEQEPTEELLEHMIRALAVSTLNFNKLITNDNDDE